VEFASLAAFGPVAWYVFTMAVTPGPNNAMLTASGMNFGLKRTWPHIFGIAGGVFALFLLTGFGLGALFQTVAWAATALAVVGSLYLVYLAWRIANAAAPSAAEGARPLSFWEAFGFQFLNPKGWVMALTAVTLTPDQGGVLSTALTLVGVGMIFGTPAMCVWAGFGAALREFLKNDKVRRIVNWTLAAILLLTIPFMFR